MGVRVGGLKPQLHSGGLRGPEGPLFHGRGNLPWQRSIHGEPESIAAWRLRLGNLAWRSFVVIGLSSCARLDSRGRLSPQKSFCPHKIHPLHTKIHPLPKIHSLFTKSLFSPQDHSWLSRAASRGPDFPVREAFEKVRVGSQNYLVGACYTDFGFSFGAEKLPGRAL